MNSTGRAPAPDLVAFLRARYDEDEQEARAATPGPWRWRQEHGEPWEPEEGGWLDYSGEYISGADDSGTLFGPGMTPHADAVHIARHDPARVLREIDAKRQLVNVHGRPHECIALTGSGERSVVDGQPWELWEPEHTSDHGPCTTLRLLALPYADWPGYREEWRP
ncbi:DUF6221 family protein [Streptomyces sp. C10-9-1]|uniref:DUF6221 family protein n=1 Tax=Streptomyces sp. C10-9-1 TaxID=1859285 RepID=UPI003F49DA15